MTSDESGTSCGGVHAELGRGHREVEREVVVARQERQHLDGRRRGERSRARACGRAAPRRPPTRLWPSSPMRERLADQRRDVDRLRRLDGGVEDRPEHLGHPAQPVDDLRAVGAEAQHLAQPLVQGGEGVPRPVRRRRRPARPASTGRPRPPSGRPPRGGGTARRRCRPRRAPARRPRRRGGPALEEGRADECAAHRPAHPARRDRRPGVQHGARRACQRVDRRTGRADAHDTRAHRVHRGDRDRVGRGRRLVVEGDHRARRGEVGERRRAPVELRHVRRRAPPRRSAAARR